MTSSRRTLLLLVLWAVLLSVVRLESVSSAGQKSPSDVKFAAWNLRTFGRSKMAKPAVVAIITQIIQRYDLVLLQEIRDKTGAAIQNLLKQLNSQSPENPFRMSLSARLGRSQTKEQYAFLYRSNRLRVLDEYQYPDRSDIFEREPYSVKFSSNDAVLGDFVVMAIHTSPTRAKREISALYEVFNNVKNHWKTERILIAGDLNAGCTYLRSWRGISLRSDKQLHWLISDAQDTTATDTDCAYDRLITHDALFSSVIRGSAKVLRFDDLRQLTTAEALLVSDHYPVELRLNDKRTDVSSSSAMTCNDVRKKTLLAVFAIIAFRT